MIYLSLIKATDHDIREKSGDKSFYSYAVAVTALVFALIGSLLYSHRTLVIFHT